jgi:predicted amidohydrolase YtcJ
VLIAVHTIILFTSGTQADFDNDPLVKGRPVVLQQKDGHALWVSSKIVEQMLPIPEEVEGGYIRRDASGSPTGMVRWRPAIEAHISYRSLP